MAIAIESHRIAYMALPKAGCTSVKSALAQVDPVVPWRLRRRTGDVMHWHRVYPTQRFRPHRWQQFQDFWRFCVVRDPVKRLMSAYLNRVVEMRELHNSRKLARGRFPHLTADPDPDFFFQNMWEYVEASSTIKHHVMPAWLFLGPHLDYDRVYRTDELPALADDLSDRTGVQVHMRRENPTKTKLGLADLSDRTIDALRPYLDEEYAFLSSYYANPLHT